MATIYRAGLQGGKAIRTVTDTRTGKTTIETGSSRDPTSSRTIDTPVTLTRRSLSQRRAGATLYSTQDLRALDIMTGVGATAGEESRLLAEISDENLAQLAMRGQPGAIGIIGAGGSYVQGNMSEMDFDGAGNIPSPFNIKTLILVAAGLFLLTGGFK